MTNTPTDIHANSRRRVCNLTPWEVEKKRAIDRANQQHWRQKKRLYIAELEAKVAQLTEKLEATQAKLRQHEEKEGSQSGSSDSDTAHQTPTTEDGPSSPIKPTSATSPVSLTSLTSRQSPASPLSPPTPTQVEAPTPQPQLQSQTEDLQLDIVNPPSFAVFGGVQVDIDANAPSQIGALGWPPSAGIPSPLATHLPYVPHYLAGRGHPFPNPHSSFPHMNPYNVPDWMDLPLNLPVATELDKLVLITSQALVQRYSAREFSQPVFPRVERLTRQASRKSTPKEGAEAAENGENDSHPILAAVANHIVWKSPLKQLTSRLAFLYKLALFVRWCLCPSPSTYNALPHFLRPTLLQRRVPHPVWIDLIMWPDVRDKMIQAGDFSRFELFRAVTGQSMTVNWPYTDSGTFVELDGGNMMSDGDGEGSRQVLNPIFEAHIRDGNNYSVSAEAAALFPVLSEHVGKERRAMC